MIKYLLKIKKLWLWSAFLVVLFAACEKESKVHNSTVPNQFVDEKSAFEKAKQKIPRYYKLLSFFKSQGYTIWNFKTFYYSDKTKLPEKLLIIRHDIHFRDIDLAYDTYLIEKFFLGSANTATYFVMLDDPSESGNPFVRQKYLDFISFLKKRQVDVQPHISPNEMYLKRYHPSWIYKSEEELKKIVQDDYVITKTDKGTTIEAKGKDELSIGLMNSRMIQMLKDYNTVWKASTGLEVFAYAAHGSKIPINYALNNAILLDQLSLLRSGVYHFDAYNSWISKHLTYLSDNEVPPWMNKPELIAPKRYQLLVHPYLWDGLGSETLKNFGTKPGVDTSFRY